ncbi:CBS domain-containing protein [Actinokineospora sp. HUAS TT18]|uniref:CBS domain-containing protein n=1 Tax=Actinokineospora sp. HUAS TT18 TaxID=3447451 RepID=UPI003F521FA2
MRGLVKQVMSTDVATVTPAARFKDIVRVMHHRDVSALPVVDAGRGVLGVVSTSDLVGAQARPGVRRWRLRWHFWRSRGTHAGELMSRPARTIGPEATIAEAARLLDRHRIKRLPVVDTTGALVGIVSRGDLLSVYLRTDEDIADEVTHDVLEHGLGLTVTPATVTVAVDGGVVRLRGEVERRSMIGLIESMARGIDGVVDVDAELTFVADDTQPAVKPATDLTHEPWLSHRTRP